MYKRPRRFFQRVDVTSDHAVTFRNGERQFENVPIVSLSAGGCLAVVPPEVAAVLRHGAILLDFALAHPELPGTRITAQVARLADEPPGESAAGVGLAISFLSNSPQFTERVDAYVAEQIRRRPASGAVGSAAAAFSLLPPSPAQRP